SATLIGFVSGSRMRKTTCRANGLSMNAGISFVNECGRSAVIPRKTQGAEVGAETYCSVASIRVAGFPRYPDSFPLFVRLIGRSCHQTRGSFGVNHPRHFREL